MLYKHSLLILTLHWSILMYLNDSAGLRAQSRVAMLARMSLNGATEDIFYSSSILQIRRHQNVIHLFFLLFSRYALIFLFVSQPYISWECSCLFKTSKNEYMSHDIKEIVHPLKTSCFSPKMGIIRVLLHRVSLFGIKRDKTCIEHSTVSRM